MRYYIEEDTSTTPPTLVKVPICGSYINYNTAPIGSIQQYSGTSLPPGWLWCNGSAYNRTFYKFLFNVIGTTYGTGDGSTTFNVPSIPDLATGIKYIIKAYSTADAKELGIDPGSIPDLPNFGTPIDVTGTFAAIADGATWTAPWTGFVYFNVQNTTDATHRISLVDKATNNVAAYAYIKNVGGVTSDIGISGGMVVKDTTYKWYTSTSTTLRSALLTPVVNATDGGELPRSLTFGNQVDVRSIFEAMQAGSTWVAPWTGSIWLSVAPTAAGSAGFYLSEDGTSNTMVLGAWNRQVGSAGNEVSNGSGIVIKGKTYHVARSNASITSAMLTPVVDAANPQDLPEVPGRWGNIENWTTVINSITPGTEWVAPATGMISLHPASGPATAGVQYRTYIAEVVNGTTMPAHIWCSYSFDADGQSFLNVSSGIIQKGHKYLINSNTGADNVYAAMFTPFITDSTVPVDDPGEVYTTTETKVGTWIDGKPIYRKVFVDTVGTNPTIGTRSLATGIPSGVVDDVITLKTTFKDTNTRTYWWGTDWVGASSSTTSPATINVYLNNNGTSLDIQNTATWPASSRMIIILEYTKTTD
jgi:microcystin-dependent protein